MAFAFFTFYLYFEAAEIYHSSLTSLPFVDVIAASITILVASSNNSSSSDLSSPSLKLVSICSII